MPQPSPSGAQYALTLGAQQAVIVERGGGLRTYTVGGRPVVDGWAEDEPCPGCAGDVLAPWPGRVEDATYTFQGTEHRLVPTPGQGSAALHGLVNTRPWRLLARDAAAVTLGVELAGEPGYPFPLALTMRWALTPDGLVATHGARNPGPTPCPVALGAHPYLGGGTGRVDDLVLHLPARTVQRMDAALIPRETLPVGALGFDFRSPARIGARVIDHTFGALVTDAAGRGTLTVADPGGFTTELWWEAPFRYIHLYTSDTLGPARFRRSLSVEPHTAPHNALRSGQDLLVLAPGEAVEARWGLRVHAG